MTTRITSAVLVLALAASPAFAEQETLKGAVQQPLRDLSIQKEKTPEVLQNAAKGAYDNVDPNNCEAMKQEIIALDDALGTDLKDVDLGGKDGSLVTDAVKSAVRLPFAGVVRRLTGAQKRQQEHDQAVIAGVARRAYLKGAIQGCAAQPIAPPPVIIRTEARPEPTPPPVLARPTPATERAQPASAQVPDAPRGTLEAQAQEAVTAAPAGTIQRRTVTVATP